MRHPSRGPVPPVRPGKNTRTALAPAEEQNCRFVTWGYPRVFFQKPGIQATGRLEVLSLAMPSERIWHTAARMVVAKITERRTPPWQSGCVEAVVVPAILC